MTIAAPTTRSAGRHRPRRPRRRPRRPPPWAAGPAGATTIAAPWCWRGSCCSIGVTAVAQLVGTRFQNDFTAGNTPSQQAANILDSRFPTRSGDTADVVFHTAAPVTSAANRAAISRGGASAPARWPMWSAVTSPFSAAGAHQVAADDHIAYAVVQFDTTADRLPARSVKAVIATAEAADHSGFSVALGGNPISAVVTAAPGPSEGIGVTAAVLIMLLAFGSVVAMGLPDHHRAVRPRDRYRALGAGHPPPRGADLRSRNGRHDRHRRGHRLRPVHRHPLPAGDLRGP